MLSNYLGYEGGGEKLVGRAFVRVRTVTYSTCMYSDSDSDSEQTQTKSSLVISTCWAVSEWF